MTPPSLRREGSCEGCLQTATAALMNVVGAMPCLAWQRQNRLSSLDPEFEPAVSPVSLRLYLSSSTVTKQVAEDKNNHHLLLFSSCFLTHK